MKKTFEVSQNKKPILICGISDSNKSLLIKQLCEEYPDIFAVCITYTTKPETETDERCVISDTAFSEMTARGEFLQQLTIDGYRYGIAWDSIKSVIETDRFCIIDVSISSKIFNPSSFCIRIEDYSIITLPLYYEPLCGYSSNKVITISQNDKKLTSSEKRYLRFKRAIFLAQRL